MKIHDKLRNGSWAITLPLAVGAVAYLWFLFVPGMRSTAEVRNQLRAKQDEVLQGSELRKAILNMERELVDTQKLIDAWHDQSPDETDLATLFGRINELTKLAGVTTTRFEPREAVEYELFKQVRIMLTVSGSYSEIHKLLAGLESLPQTVWIENISLSTGEEPSRVACQFELVIFAGRAGNSGQAGSSRKPI